MRSSRARWRPAYIHAGLNNDVPRRTPVRAQKTTAGALRPRGRVERFGVQGQDGKYCGGRSRPLPRARLKSRGNCHQGDAATSSCVCANWMPIW